MKEHTYSTPLGDIRYWTNPFVSRRATLVFLPGLTADHTLFDKQIETFESLYNLLVWDAPGHGQSRPFRLEFTLRDKARWLHEMLTRYITDGSRPVLLGQSMGGYVAQEYVVQYPDEVAGVVCIDSAPLERAYITGIELWMLRHIKPVYQCYPWDFLRKAAAKGCAVSPYGQALMMSMIGVYTHAEYCTLAAFGYQILADAIEHHTSPILCLTDDCRCTFPVLLLAGEHDKAGSCLRYCKEWSKRANLPLVYVPRAGHNSNTDNPQFVNEHLQSFITNQILNQRDV
ncbi:MAG: alpha/beta fold hydrolase [Paludibacteraceae bacterium]